jgi:hypothetical protein
MLPWRTYNNLLKTTYKHVLSYFHKRSQTTSQVISQFKQTLDSCIENLKEKEENKKLCGCIYIPVEGYQGKPL